MPESCSLEPQSAITEDLSKASQGVYVLLVNDDDNLARKLTGQWTYMQQNVSDPARPNGHMTLEYHYSHNLAWSRPLDKIAELNKFMLPEPANFSWWRSVYDNPSCKLSGLMKRNTQSISAGLANTGDLITFQNNPVG